MTWYATIVGGAIAALGSWMLRDGYACLPRIQKMLTKMAARLLPPEYRAAAMEQWEADLLDLWPSELYRTWIAADLIRGAVKLRTQLPRETRFWRIPLRLLVPVAKLELRFLAAMSSIPVLITLSGLNLINVLLAYYGPGRHHDASTAWAIVGAAAISFGLVRFLSRSMNAHFRERIDRLEVVLKEQPNASILIRGREIRKADHA